MFILSSSLKYAEDRGKKERNGLEMALPAITLLEISLEAL